jgi:hypothetical protein
MSEPIAGGAGTESGAPSSGDAALDQSQQYVEEVARDAIEGAGGEPEPAEPAAPAAPSPGGAPSDARREFETRYRDRQELRRALSEANERSQRLEAQIQQLGQQVRPPAPPGPGDPEPDRADSFAWSQWAIRQGLSPMATQLQQLQQLVLSQAQQQQQRELAIRQDWQARQAFDAGVASIDQAEREYEGYAPGFRGRVDAAGAHLVAFHEQSGYAPQDARRLAIQQLHAIWQEGARLGRHPAAFLDDQIRRAGIQGPPPANGNGAAAAPEPPAAPANPRIAELRRAQGAPEAGSLSQAGSRTPRAGSDEVGALTQHGRSATRAADLHRVARAKGDAALDDIYRTAHKQESGR